MQAPILFTRKRHRIRGNPLGVYVRRRPMNEAHAPAAPCESPPHAGRTRVARVTRAAPRASHVRGMRSRGASAR